MNQSRRDLLKFFGAGTIIAPAAGGALAKLIEPPKAEIIRPETGIVAPFMLADITGVDVAFKMRDGSVRRMDVDYTDITAPATDHLSRLHLCIQIQRSHQTSPAWAETVMNISIEGRIRNRNAIVELGSR